MNRKLDRRLKNWLENLAEKWKTSPSEAVKLMDRRPREIPNREINYPSIRDSLLRIPVDLNSFALSANKSYVLGNRYDGPYFTYFIKEKHAAKSIRNLLTRFPERDDEVATRIDKFISDLKQFAYYDNKGSFQMARVATLASLILTTVFPKRFVDFRWKRWRKFAETFGYPTPDKEASYGEKIVWAGKFAQQLAATQTLKKYWGEYEPLWAVAGICWIGSFPVKPPPKLEDYFESEDEQKYQEGGKQKQLRSEYKRNQKVIRRKKEMGFMNDPMLHCEICNFSFRETYGKIGEKFIEGHHANPIAGRNTQTTTRLSDIHLVCSNCHSMIHRKGRILSILEINEMVRSKVDNINA